MLGMFAPAWKLKGIYYFHNQFWPGLLRRLCLAAAERDCVLFLSPECFYQQLPNEKKKIRSQHLGHWNCAFFVFPVEGKKMPNLDRSDWSGNETVAVISAAAGGSVHSQKPPPHPRPHTHTHARVRTHTHKQGRWSHPALNGSIHKYIIHVSL